MQEHFRNHTPGSEDVNLEIVDFAEKMTSAAVDYTSKEIVCGCGG